MLLIHWSSKFSSMWRSSTTWVFLGKWVSDSSSFSFPFFIGLALCGIRSFLLRRFLLHPQLVSLRLVMFSAGGQSRVIVSSMYRWSEIECSIPTFYASSWLSRESDIRVILLMKVGSLPSLQISRFDWRRLSYNTSHLSFVLGLS